MNGGDLVNPFWSSKIAGNTAEIGLCVYFGDRPGSLRGDLAYYTLLSSEGMIEIPSWHWELEVISECR